MEKREERLCGNDRTAEGESILQGQTLGEGARPVHDEPQGAAVRCEHAGEHRPGEEQFDYAMRRGLAEIARLHHSPLPAEDVHRCETDKNAGILYTTRYNEKHIDFSTLSKPVQTGVSHGNA